MTITGVLLLAVIDSINPSAIVVTLYLLSIAKSRAFFQVVVYVSAIFITYLTLGVMMVLGIDALLPSLGSALRTQAGLIAQGIIGLAMLVYSLTASTSRTTPQAVARPSVGTYAAIAVLGVSVTAMELPTAIPYFAAVALITGSELPIRTWAPLLVIYNLVFVLPPIALLVGHILLSSRLAKPYAALRQTLERSARETMLWVVGLVGAGLLVTSVIELLARSR